MKGKHACAHDNLRTPADYASCIAEDILAVSAFVRIHVTQSLKLRAFPQQQASSGVDVITAVLIFTLRMDLLSTR
jgi:hypothetical protein